MAATFIPFNLTFPKWLGRISGNQKCQLVSLRPPGAHGGLKWRKIYLMWFVVWATGHWNIDECVIVFQVSGDYVIVFGQPSIASQSKALRYESTVHPLCISYDREKKGPHVV